MKLLEGVLVLVIVGLLLFFLGVPFSMMGTVLLWSLVGLLMLSLAVMIVFFLGCSIVLMLCRKENGRFVRYEHFERFDRAVYLVNGEEFACVFPAENLARKKIYGDSEIVLRVYRGKKRKYAFDPHSILIIRIGTAFSVCCILIVAFMMFQMFL